MEAKGGETQGRHRPGPSGRDGEFLVTDVGAQFCLGSRVKDDELLNQRRSHLTRVDFRGDLPLVAGESRAMGFSLESA